MNGSVNRNDNANTNVNESKRFLNGIGDDDEYETQKKYYESLMEPCKICGNQSGNIIGYTDGKYRVICTECFYQTRKRPTFEDAIKSWNQRGGKDLKQIKMEGLPV